MLPIMDSKPVKQDSTKGSFQKRALTGRCGIFFACVLFLGLLVLLIILPEMDRKYACAGDTVYLGTIDVNIWTWIIGFNEELYTDPVGAPHLSDIYIAPTANVNVYSTEKSFKGDAVFQANFSKSGGQILYLYQIESLEYKVTAWSKNESTTDGRLLIFKDHNDYYTYVYSDFTQAAEFAIFRKTFPIGANSTPVTTVIKFNQSSVPHSYYFVTCTTPANTTISYNATVKLWYYDYKDFGPKNCSIKQNSKGTNSCVLYYTPRYPVSAFAYVNPDPNLVNKPITILDIQYHRVLPPPALLVVGICGMVFGVLSIVLYLLRCMS